MPRLKPGTILPTRKQDATITAAARRDPEAMTLTEAQWKEVKPHARIGRPLAEAPKVAVKLRLDPDLLAVLRATGPGWQTRANRILRERFAL